MSDRIVTATVSADFNTVNLAPKFARIMSDDSGQSSLSYQESPFWFVDECEWSIGIEPSKALVNIMAPAGSRDFVPNDLVFATTGPYQFIKGGTRVTVVMRKQGILTTPVFCGTVTTIKHIRTVGGVGMACVVQDDRYLLKNIRIVGRHVANTGSGSAPYASSYQQGWDAHFNPGGRANMMLDDNGDPCFAPFPDFGLSADEQPITWNDEGASETLTRKAGYWTLSAILEYLRLYYGPDATIPTEWAWLRKCPDVIEWPVGFGTSIDTAATANFDQGNGQNFSRIGSARKGRDINLEGLDILSAFEVLLSTAGGWTLTTEPSLETGSDGQTEFRNVLRVVPSRYQFGGIKIPFAAGGNVDAAMGAYAIVTAATYEEDCSDTATVAAGAGDLIFTEIRVNTEAGGGLTEGWTAARQAAFLTEAATAVTSGNYGSNEAAFQAVHTKYWEVFTTWKVDPSFNFPHNTDFADFPRATIPRPVWPTLLTFQTGVSGEELGPGDGVTIPYPIRIECQADDGNYKPGPIFDGLTVLDNGLIYLPQLAYQGLGSDGVPGAWRWTGQPFAESGGALQVTAQEIRFTVAIPADHRITRASAISSEEITSQDLLEVWKDLPDQDRLEKGFSRLVYLDLRGLYQLWLRRNSYPLPQTATANGESAFSNLTTVAAALRSDADLLNRHVTRAMYDYGRLRKGGSLFFDGKLCAVYQPGMSVESLWPVGGAGTAEAFPIRAVVSRVVWRVNAERGTHTELMLA